MTSTAMTDWDFIPPIDPFITVSIALMIVGLGIRDLLRNTSVPAIARLALRVLAVAGLALLLLGPGRWIVPAAPDKPDVTILIDRSRSMSIADATGCSRLESLKRAWLNDASLRALQSSANVSLLAIDEHAERIPLNQAASLAPEGGQSKVASAVAGTIARTRRASHNDSNHLLLLSDAADTDGLTLAALAPEARSARLRPHIVLPESAPGHGETRMDAAFDRTWVRAGEPARLRIDLSDSAPAFARLIVRESSDDGPIAAEQSLSLGARQRIDLELTPPSAVEPGGIALARYIVSIEPSAEGGARPSATASIQVVGRRLRVVLFERDPSWDTRFFADALAAEPDIELTTVYSLDGPARALTDAPPRLRITTIVPGLDTVTRTLGTPAPDTPESLEPFDLFVIGRNVPSMLPSATLAHLRSLIMERGRAALFLRGPEDSAPLLWASPFIEPPTDRTIIAPIIAFEPALVPRGSPAIEVAELNLQLGTLAPAVGTLATAGNQPLIVEAPLGTGRVGTVLADGLWRASMSDEQSAAIRRLWVTLAHRLASGADVPPGAAASLALDRTESAPGESVKVIVRTREPRMDLSKSSIGISGPDRSLARRTLTRDPANASKWTVHISPALPGGYTLQLTLPASPDGRRPATLESALSVRIRDIEMRDTTPRRADAEAFASAASGRVWPLDSFDEFIDFLRRETTAREGTPRFEPLWDNPWVLIVIVSLLSTEWWWRRREGFA